MRIAREFRNPYCLRALYFSLVRSVLESCVIVWSPYAELWIRNIESVQSRFIRFALRFLPWCNRMELPPYKKRCCLLGMDTLAKRRKIFGVVMVGKLLTGLIDAPCILSQININAPARNFRSADILRLDFQHTVYGQNEPIMAICSSFNSLYVHSDFCCSSDSFKNRLRQAL